MLLRRLWLDIEDATGKTFSLDACADDRGDNSQCPEFCCPADSFLVKDLAGHHVWLNAPFVGLSQFVDRYLQQKGKHPEVSACILVPCRACDTPVHEKLKHMQVIMQYEAGTTLFSAPADGGARRILPPCPFAVKVYYDAPAQVQHSFRACPDTRLAMIVEGQLSLTPATYLLDSGASTCFLSASLAKELQLVIKPYEGNATTADGKSMPIVGTCSAHVKIQAYQGMISFLVCDMTDQFDVVLGDTWLSKNKAHLDYENRSCVLRRNSKHLTIRMTPAADDSCQTRQHIETPLLSALQAKRAVRHGAQAYLVMVTRDGDADNTAQINSLSTNSSVFDAKLQKVLQEFKHVFPDELPYFDPVDTAASHTIPTLPNSRAPCGPIYRLSQPEMQELKKQVAELLLKGYIEPSTSPYGAPVLFVRKKDGSLRMCVDYRALNKITIKNKYPLPRIDDLLDKLNGSTCFSSIDLKSGYYQIPIHEDDIPKTAFRTQLGHFQWRCTVMGLTNSPSSFQNIMNNIFRDYLNDFVLVYLDDILIFSRSPEEHLRHLELVLRKLEEYKLSAHLKKCQFGKSHLDFLGHVIGADGIRVDPKKVAVVQEWPKPKDVSQLRSFLGLANYFRRFMKNYSTIVAPLTSLLKKGKSIKDDWGPACDTAFAEVKRMLTSAPVLQAPDFSKPFVIHTDASIEGLGAALLQEGKPVAFYSRKLNAAERNYTTTEQECLAVLCALREWRCYLEGVSFTLYTDHQPLTFTNSKAGMSRRQIRWVEEFQRYTFEWRYKKGSDNVVADSLSRVPALLNNIVILAATTRSRRKSVTWAEPLVRTEGDDVGEPPRKKSKQADNTTSPTRRTILDQIRDAYKQDSALNKPDLNKYTQKQALLWKNNKIVVPAIDSLRTLLMQEAHDTSYSGHFGWRKTLNILQRHFYWNKMSSQVKRFVATCDSCQRMKASNQKQAGLLQPLSIPTRNWESVSMDLITDLPLTARGNDAVLVVVDRLSKMTHFAPCKKTISSLELAQLFTKEIIRLHGFQRSLVMDRDPRFTSQFWKDLCTMFGTKLRLSTAFHPQTDGQTERMNRTLEDCLRHYVSPTQADWDLHLAPMEFAINNAKQDSTGLSPFQMNYGMDPLTPLNLDMDCKAPTAQEMASTIDKNMQKAKTALNAAQNRMKNYTDKSRRHVEFKVGDKVLLNTKNIHMHVVGPKKLLPRWCGPFKILKTIGPVAYKLELPANMKIHNVFHVALLKAYRSDTRSYDPPPPITINGDIEFEVETILSHRDRKRGRGSTREYLVKWTGYGPEHNTWEPERHLSNCSDAIQSYMDRPRRLPAPQAATTTSSRQRTRATRTSG